MDRHRIKIVAHVHFIGVFLADAGGAGEAAERILRGDPGTERIQTRGKQTVVLSQQQPGEQLADGVFRLRIDVDRALFLGPHLAEHDLFRQRKPFPGSDPLAHGKISLIVDERPEIFCEVFRADQRRLVFIKGLPAFRAGKLLQQGHANLRKKEKKQKEKALKPGKSRDVQGRTGTGCLRSAELVPAGSAAGARAFSLCFYRVLLALQGFFDAGDHIGTGVPPALVILVEAQVRHAFLCALLP